MAKLCMSYLTFDCFNPKLSDMDLLEHIKKGDYAFQEYAACNWIHHVESLKENWGVLQTPDCIFVYDACSVLHERDKQAEHPEMPPSSSLTKPGYEGIQEAIIHLRAAYDKLDSVSEKEPNECEFTCSCTPGSSSNVKVTPSLSLIICTLPLSTVANWIDNIPTTVRYISQVRAALEDLVSS